MELNQQNIQKKRAIRRKIDWVNDKSFSDDVEA
jgi:hypothetical protein